MKYVNAEKIIPQPLLKEIQKYIHGGILYIPSPEQLHKRWGEKSGSRKYLQTRNEEIREKFSNGMSVDQLAALYCLSNYSIKKIIYPKK